MTVHIDELHSELAPTGGAREASPSNAESPSWMREEMLTAALRRRDWIEARTAAEAFVD